MSSRARLLIAATLVVLASGCTREDPRVKGLGVGISKDSVQLVMEVPATDPGKAYLVNGQYIEVYIVRRRGVEGPTDSLTRKQLTPVVLVDGKVTGWGWPHWDSVGTFHKIEIKPAK